MKFLPTIADAIPTEWLDFLVVFAAAVLTALVVLVCVFFSKKKRRHKHRRHHRGEHREMNPTLAQTGGLPPIRKTENPPDQPKS